MYNARSAAARPRSWRNELSGYKGSEALYGAALERLRQMLDQTPRELFTGGLKGIEKESLRVTHDGHIAQTPHPTALGSALTHPHITTDYSEALLELITDPVPRSSTVLESLEQLHRFVYSHLDDEMLWATSMPCVVDGERSIPIARYGSSNIGRMKHIYRRGLDVRYGRTMQAIAGVHFNYSLPVELWPALQEFEDDSSPLRIYISDAYFRLIRNFQRLGWLIPFLFGSSPAVCPSFLGGRRDGFQCLDGHTLYEPYGTSLRMSDIGYKNKAQSGLNVSYNNLEDYVASLTRAIETPDPDYAAIGTHKNGQWQQLNTNVLQIENEYYSFVRPKRPTRSGEKPTAALSREGVEYVEIRALDVSPFHPVGVSACQLRFLEAMLIFCLFEDSPPIDEAEREAINHNQALVARRGREPGLRLRRNGGTVALLDWARETCEALAGICEALDTAEPATPYTDALKIQYAVVADPELSPSARVLREMAEHEESFVEFALRVSREQERHFRSSPFPPETQAAYDEQARQSLEAQREIEEGDTVPFERYLQDYFAQH